MKVPEKLYINSKQRPDKEIFYGTCTKVEDNDIEYVRTDAFIEKACEWIDEHFMNIEWEIATYEFKDIQSLKEEFKKAMRR